jgi:seryl-tRNA synthetase
MAMEEQVKLLLKLDKLGTDIPGLNPNKVLNNLIEKNDALKSQVEIFNTAKEENIERGMSADEAEARVKEARDKAIADAKKQMEPMVKEEITKMKQQYKIAKESLDSIPAEVQSTIATIVIPPAISVPPSAPNPIYSLGIALQTKKNLMKTLNIVISALTQIILIANKLKFELPTPVTTLVATLISVAGLLSTIPG